MKELRQKAIKSAALACAVLCLFGGIIGVLGVQWAMESFREPIPLEEVDLTGDLQDMYVSTTVYYIYDPYAQETDGLELVAYEYLIDADDTYYMGLRAGTDYIDATEALLQASYNYYDGLDDGTELAKYKIEVTGLMQKMPEESLDLYHEYVGYDELETSKQILFLPYYLEIGMKSRVELPVAIIFVVFGLVLAGFGIFALIKAISGKNQKELNDYINNSGSPEAAKERIERFLTNAPSIHGLQCDNEFICGASGAAIVFGETDKLVWAYSHTRVGKYNSKTYDVRLVFTDGKLQIFNVKKEEEGIAILQQLNLLCPKAIIGFSDELEKMYKKNFPGFLNLKYNVTVQSGDVE